MARMGNRPIEIPDGVEIDIDGDTVVAEGPEGTLEHTVTSGISVEVDGDQIIVNRSGDTRDQKSQHGLHRSLLENIVTGVSEGFTRTLELNGLGYRARKQGSDLVLELGYSNPVTMEIPDDVEVELPNDTTIKLSAIDKETVGQYAAKLRKLRDPDPYNQKGIKYKDEHIRQKVGKAVGGEGEGMGAEAT